MDRVTINSSGLSSGLSCLLNGNFVNGKNKKHHRCY